MIVFFRAESNLIYAVGTALPFSDGDVQKLGWLFDKANLVRESTLPGYFIGPRKEMVTPWSTNAVEITQTMGLRGIGRIEEFRLTSNATEAHDPMLERLYTGLDQDIFTIHHQPDLIVEVDDIAAYSKNEGLALSPEEIEYLNDIAGRLKRKLTDSEVFGFSQVNSEHCRHKIFNGTFIIDGYEKELTLFQLIRKTAKKNPGLLVSAYKDNVAFIKGPVIEQFAPARQDVPDFFEVTDVASVISLKAETHNFPTTVEPFNGAATGSGGEIRDRLAGGKGSLPLAGTAVYITSYPRLDGGRPWEKNIEARKWLYQSPAEILIKASDGASDFGNKFGQPLICGSVLTFEHREHGRTLGFDKVIMLAGGIGFGKEKDSQKGDLMAGDKIVLLGGDNYRIGMGGGAVSSVATGEYGNAIELNAIQRSNPEMQKRVMNAIRAMVESSTNPVISIHDHGAGGHLNCFSELLEGTGGVIETDQLPVGDPTLSDKEIISNESQERMGLAIRESDLGSLKRVADRERAPLYTVGTATGDHKFSFVDNKKNLRPVELDVIDLFGSSPKTILQGTTATPAYLSASYNVEKIEEYLHQVLQLEAVACKDWLTNKVDRSVTGKVATQQTCGPLQLPLNNVSVMALDFLSHKGVATAIGHAPAAALIDPAAGGRLAIAEALTNLVWTPLTHGLKGVSLSANWMWPAKHEGENARLYCAVEAVSDFACALGINIPTGKDSLSMTQKYPDGDVVFAPGTVIISAVGEAEDIRQTVSPALKKIPGSKIIYVRFSAGAASLGGSSLGQVLNTLGQPVPDVADPEYFCAAFEALQHLIRYDLVLAGHDVSSGGLITTLLEMCFPIPDLGMAISLAELAGDPVQLLFAENPGVIIQVQADREFEVWQILSRHELTFLTVGEVMSDRRLTIAFKPPGAPLTLEIDACRDRWFKTSHLLDKLQRTRGHADIRKKNIFNQPLTYSFQKRFDGKYQTYGIDPARRTPSGIRAAIIREKGVNGDREMAYALYLAGFDVKDVHMTDLVSGREDLSAVNLIVFVGGFSNSDVLGSAKGWAGAFLYNPKAKAALDQFYARPDTLSLGVCNGCQLMMELGLVYREDATLERFRKAGWEGHPRMTFNGSGKFESAFVNVTIPENNSVMLRTYAGARLGVWLAHGEGRFRLPADQTIYQVTANYAYAEYPGNPNDSDFGVASLCSHDGRHLVLMPHIERSLFVWNWPYYPAPRREDEISPWMEAFVNAREWVRGNLKIR
jgi:phosphoribosylformylglycinamidine synthase